MHAARKSSVWLTASHRRTMLTSTDNVDSNRMFKKHNPRRMMMNGLNVATVPYRTAPYRTVRPPTDGRRRLTKSLMNDVVGSASALAPPQGASNPSPNPSSNAVAAVDCVFIFAQSENSKTATTLATRHQHEHPNAARMFWGAIFIYASF